MTQTPSEEHFLHLKENRSFTTEQVWKQNYFSQGNKLGPAKSTVVALILGVSVFSPLAQYFTIMDSPDHATFREKSVTTGLVGQA